LSQRKLGDLVGLSEDQVSLIERGKSWTGELSFALFADVLGVPQKSLTDYSENEAFIAAGGFSKRASRRHSHLIVRRKKQVVVRIPQDPRDKQR
jgi:transcriptional regulator with XRE-family HTH domain